MAEIKTERLGFRNDVDQEQLTSIFKKRAIALANRGIGKSELDDGFFSLVFLLGNERYALALESLSEVLPFAKHTPVPKAETMICGIINLRGKLHSVLDLAALMGLAKEQDDQKGYILILRRNGVGLRVTAVEQILFSEKAAPGLGMDTGISVPGQYRSAVLEDNIILLNIEKILSHSIFDSKGEFR